MSWEERLITLYLLICKEYKSSLWVSCQRFTNGGKPNCSDEELMTIYIFGILNGLRTLKSIHRYSCQHLHAYFPNLPGYTGFVGRINRLHEAFRLLIEVLQAAKVGVEDEGVYLIDSFPIMLARHQHAYRAKVAPELASRSYNATKKMHYYGVRAHVVGRKRQASLPELEILVLEEAARQDGPVFDQIRPSLQNNLVFADQAYKRPDALLIEQCQDLKVLTPCTKKNGQKSLEPEQKAYSKAISRIKQPIEAFFAWITRKTDIQNAGLVRSSAGFMTHIFSRFAAAMILSVIPDFDS